MKKIFGFVLIVSLFFIVGCGKNNNEYAGVYKLEYGKFVGDPITAKDTTSTGEITLNEDGTGKSNYKGILSDVTWKIEDEGIIITEFNTEYKGTLENGILDIFDGDKNENLTYEFVYKKTK